MNALRGGVGLARTSMEASVIGYHAAADPRSDPAPPPTPHSIRYASPRRASSTKTFLHPSFLILDDS